MTWRKSNRAHFIRNAAITRSRSSVEVAVTARCSANEIRAQSLANLERWQQAGSWVSAYDEWRQLLLTGDDGAMFAAMLGRDERCNRLRQSPPYVGLLPRDEVRALNEEASA